MKIAIASGKGGTGKTTIAVNMALSLKNVQLLDCDVEEPNAALFLKKKPRYIQDVCLRVPCIDETRCTRCGDCAKFCRYNALAVLPKKVLIFPELCHGCGGCILVCPQHAITETERRIGVIEGFKTKDLAFLQGRMNVGEPLATPVIKALKSLMDDKKTVLLDSPPGTACPVVETVGDCDYCILVTEPTPFGLHDLELAVAVVRSMGVPLGVIINRDGIGDDKVERYCRRKNIPVLLKIPQDEEIARLYSRGIPIVMKRPQWKTRFRKIYLHIKKEAGL